MSFVKKIGRAALGIIAGLLLGVAASVGVIVANARLRGRYLSSFDEVVGWSLVPAVLGPAVGVWLALRESPAGRRVLSRVLRGLTAGVALGVGLGAAIDGHASSAWAGGVIGGAAGIFAGFAAGFLGPRRAAPEPPGAADPSPSNGD